MRSVPGDIQNLRPNSSVLLPVIQTDMESTGLADNTTNSSGDATEGYLYPLRIFDTVVTKITKVCPSHSQGLHHLRHTRYTHMFRCPLLR